MCVCVCVCVCVCIYVGGFPFKDIVYYSGGSIHIKKKLNFDVMSVLYIMMFRWIIYSQEYTSLEIDAVTIEISMTEYHHFDKPSE